MQVLVWVLLLGLFVALLFFGSREVFGSSTRAARQTLVFGLAALSYPVSWIAAVVRLIGRLLPLGDFYRWLFSGYPGYWFVEKVRADFVDYALRHIDGGAVELDEGREAEELRGYIQETHAFSGRAITDGEAVLALAMAVTGLFSLVPGWATSLLSVGLLVAVATRVTTMESMLFGVPADETSTDRLEVMLAWNEGVVNTGSLFRTTVILRFIYDFDGRLYEQFLFNVTHEAFVGDGMNKRETTKRLWPAFWVILKARMTGGDARDLSEELYGEDVLRLPRFDSSQN